MEILSYLQARKELKDNLTEEQVRRILTISGRAEEWIKKIAKLVKESGDENDIAIVEQSGMGREILKSVPKEEWVYLVNPSLAPIDNVVVKECVIGDAGLFSPAFADWIKAQEIGLIYKLSEKAFTLEESKTIRLLWNKQETIVDREEIALAMWGDDWCEKYSNWGIDATMHRLRIKIVGNWQLVTIKGRGYMLAGTGKTSQAPSLALKRGEMVAQIAGSIYPSDEYIEYMNDPKRVRKVYRDLFEAMKMENITSSRAQSRDPSTTVGMTRILCVNSYSYDNVDSVAAWAPNAKIYFVHYDPRAIDMHKERVKELGLENRIECIYDDMRESKLRDASMDLVINDFRLNFNQDDKQNRAVVGHVRRILRDGGVALFSTVVDARYENIRYGADQEKAPINANKPGIFQADEHLVRRCWSVPYYKQLFEKAGFSEVIEFDIEEGKRWGNQPTLTVNPWQGPFYRRWWMRK